MLVNKRIKKKHKDYCHSSRCINNEIVFNTLTQLYMKCIDHEVEIKGSVRYRGALKSYNLHKRKTLFIGSSWKCK